jgi:NADPH:quinone reductase-like Zn-dependent oxidoreductase
MRAVVMRETGDPDVLHLENVDPPEPDEGELLIDVRAIAVNPIEWKLRRGLVPRELPAVLGSDVSGTVAESRADGFDAGDEVFGLASGAYAEQAVAPAARVARLPAGLTHEQAAAIPVAGLTAWQALFDRARLKAGQTALIAGAAGGVGHFAVQFCSHAGARAIGVGSGANRDFVMGLGASEYVDYTSQDVGQAVSGVDMAFDAVGGETTSRLVPTIRAGGMLVTIAAAPPEQAASERGVRAELLVMSPDAGQLAHIGELVAGGEVRVEISYELALADVQRAHELSESGHTRGKILLKP